jgi:hypothetical protein
MKLKYLFPLLFIAHNTALSFASCEKRAPFSHNQLDIPVKNKYVDIDGNDNNLGTRNAPFKSISKAIANALPGDTVFVKKGTYHEKVFVSNSGTIEKPIVLMPYSNDLVRINGDGLLISGTEALLTIRNAKNIQVEGFIVENFRTSAKGIDINGVIIDKGSKNISLRKNTIHHIENNASPQDGRSGHGILVIGNTDEPLTNIIVEENIVHDCNTGYSENITVNGYVDEFTIRGNKVYNGENIGIVAAGGYAGNANPALNYVRNGLISENEVYAIDGKTGPIPAFEKHNGAIGIYIDGARNIIVERNRVYRCGRGIGLVSETDNFPTQDCIVRNNVVYNNSLAGISLGGYLNYTGGGTIRCYVVNNTLYKNSLDRGYFDEFEGEIRLVENCMDNVLQNNIIYTVSGQPFIHKYTKSGRGNKIDYNLYFSENIATWIWEGQPILSSEQWKKINKTDIHSNYNENPRFVNPTTDDYRIERASPARSSANFISQQINGNFDLNGSARVVKGLLDKGAYQHQ